MYETQDSSSATQVDRIFRENVKLARAYVPFQIYTKKFDPPQALDKGTMFPELYDPYVVKRHTRRDDLYHG